MRQIILDFGGCGSEQEVHRYLKERLGFPDYYGENLDALYDCLTEIAGDTELLFAESGMDVCFKAVWENEGPAAGERMRRFLKNVKRVIEDAAEENSHLFL